MTAGAAITEPGTIVNLDYRWQDDAWKANPLSWSRKRQESGQSAKPAGDTRTGRSAEAVYQTDADRHAAAAADWDQQCLVCLGVAEASRP